MAQTFEKEGLEPQLLDLEQTKQQQWPSLTSFDSVLVGSGIRMSRWTRSATKFLKKHTDEIKTLKSKGLVVGVFVSCGMASTPGKQEEARQKYVGKILDEIGISGAVDAYDAFGGVYRPLSVGSDGFPRQENAFYGGKTDGQRWRQP